MTHDKCSHASTRGSLSCNTRAYWAPVHLMTGQLGCIGREQEEERASLGILSLMEREEPVLKNIKLQGNVRHVLVYLLPTKVLERCF